MEFLTSYDQIFEEKNSLLKLSLFANFKAKFRQKTQKNEKGILEMSLETHFTSVSGLGGQKNSKLLYPTPLLEVF
jgi:hypothetical protein